MGGGTHPCGLRSAAGENLSLRIGNSSGFDHEIITWQLYFPTMFRGRRTLAILYDIIFSIYRVYIYVEIARNGWIYYH